MSLIQFKRGPVATIPTGADGEPLFPTDQKRLYIGYSGANWLLGVLQKNDATTAPTVNEDAGDGYSVNSVWVDTTADKAYICVDSTVGSAVWKQIGGTGVGTVTSVNITPPAAGITASGGPITSSGSITLALADDLAALEALSGTNTIYYRSAANTWTAVTIGTNLSFTTGTLSATGGVSDGDKGDITVSSSGAVWTIDNDVVTFAKMQNIATQRILGRVVASTGDVTELTISDVLNLIGSGTGQIPVSSSGTWTVIGPGSTGDLLTMGATTPAWAAPALMVAAGASHKAGICGDPGATAHATHPYHWTDNATFVKPVGKTIGTNSVDTSETVASTTPQDLATAQAITFTLDVASDIFVTAGADFQNSTATASCRMDIDVDAGTSLTRIIRFRCEAAAGVYTTSNSIKISGLAAGSHTIRLYFSTSTGTGTFQSRSLSVSLVG